MSIKMLHGHEHHSEEADRDEVKHSGHSHGLRHEHSPKDFNRAYAFGVFLNLALVVAQVVFGIVAHSLALVADAGHNFADVLGLVLSWWGSKLGKSLPTKKHTYGLRSASILAALANAVLLVGTMGAVAWEAVQRLKQPSEVQGWTLIWVAAAGIVVNGVSAFLFFSGRKEDLNARGAFLHLASDAGISFGVVVAGAVILWTGLSWVDPLVSLVIVLIILWGTWGLLQDSVNLALQAVPEGIDGEAVRRYLAELPGVVEVHDLHIWGMSTTETALTVHLVMQSARVDDSFLAKAANDLGHRFNIGHATIQVEAGDSNFPCKIAPEDRV